MCVGYNHNETSVRDTLIVAVAAASMLENRAFRQERERIVCIYSRPREVAFKRDSLTYLGRSWTFLRGDIGEREK